MSLKSALVAILVASVLLGARPPRSDPHAPTAVLDTLRAADPPRRDLADLRRRIPPSAEAAGVQQPPPDHFWVLDFVNRTYHAVPVELRHTSQHADWYVERGRDARGLESAAEFFEATTFPLVTSLTGVGWTPGSQGWPKIAVFHGRVPGVGGYMSSGDLQPRSVFPYSNERPAVYVSLDGARPGSAGYNGTLAHELEHLAHSVANPGQQGWLDEGLAEFVGRLVSGSDPPRLTRFAGQPDVQLNAWSAQPWEAQAHYEASHLWVRYLAERGGGAEALGQLIRGGGRGLETVDRYARGLGLGSAEALFRDWLVANLVDDPDRLGGRFGYRGLEHRSSATASLQPGQAPVEQQVHQFAADYFDLPTSGTAELVFETAATVPLIPASDVRGAIFWSLRGDNVDTRLTRAFDLAGLAQATLRFRLWHDLETDYDYCYVLASRDGAEWQPLAGRYTSAAGGAGLTLGPGYSGLSAGLPEWVDEEIDLSAFAGDSVQVRFECVTDQNYSGSGLGLDDVQVAELGFYDDAEGDQGWIAEGFVRSANAMAQAALVLLVELSPDDLSVREMPLDSGGRGVLRFGPAGASVVRRVAIVAGLAPLTLQQMPYRVWLRALP